MTKRLFSISIIAGILFAAIRAVGTAFIYPVIISHAVFNLVMNITIFYGKI